jgi:hypothetical protein
VAVRGGSVVRIVAQPPDKEATSSNPSRQSKQRNIRVDLGFRGNVRTATGGVVTAVRILVYVAKTAAWNFSISRLQK